MKPDCLVNVSIEIRQETAKHRLTNVSSYLSILNCEKEFTMTDETLSVDESPLFHNSITHFEYHTHTPYTATRYKNNDEIRITFLQHDVFTVGEISVHLRRAIRRTITWQVN